MARARNIKPGFFLNDELAELPPLARILFEGLWCIADREGRLEDKPKRIKAEILPYDDCNVDEFLEALQQRGFILRYEANGGRYVQVINFKKHQNPHQKEPTSIIPAPVLHQKSTVQEQGKHDENPADSPFLIPDSGSLSTDSPNHASDDDELTGTDENTSGEEPNGGNDEGQGSGSSVENGEFTTEFEEFWSHYPLKIEKKTAFSAWNDRIKGGANTSEMIKACVNYAGYCEMKNTDPQFIKHASTFIGKNKPYEDYLSGIPETGENKKPVKFKAPVTTFNSYDQREYDIDDLEKKLLGREDPEEDVGG
jgi:hypothetical protein